MKAEWAPVGGKENRWSFLDGNFADVVGQVWLMVANDPALAVTDLIEPFDLRGKPPSTFKPGDFERARTAAAVFTVAESAVPKIEPRPAPATMSRADRIAGPAATDLFASSATTA